MKLWQRTVYFFSDAAYEVGYSDAAHFSRDYKSLAGAPPKLDVQRLRQERLDVNVSS